MIELSNRRVRVTPYRNGVLIALILAGVFVGSGAADPVDEAKALVAKASELANGVMEAERAGDGARAVELTQQVRATLRQAADLYEQAGAKESTDPSLVMPYADTLMRMGDLDLAGKALQRAADANPDGVEVWLALGMVMTEWGPSRDAAATEALLHVVSLNESAPAAAEALVLLGEIYRRSGLYDLATESVDKALAIQPEHHGGRMLSALLLARLGRFSEANALIDAVSKDAPQYATDRDGRLYEALRDFERRKRWIPDTADEHLAYAKLLLRVNRLPDSLAPLERAVDLKPDDYVSWNLLGSAYRGVGHVDDARNAFEQSLAVNPDQPRTREVLQQLAAPVATAPAGQQ